ncbi:class I SAM-dependent methyltransferase [Brevibacterium sp. UCMA 11754]|uniref:class I SAM-dependent methyltransferase n=1 Tax=Brevibacterium sp. UCMA 11754 TaxID=2749198 RepID=UPI002285C8C9|nr:methyltransferase domain-containing protein [Brevibacterium sp. UCMA 11754]MCF2573853.1 class I SAM-dependent methyltransferase [Brevibacterium sp. UCMA 11754]
MTYSGREYLFTQGDAEQQRLLAQGQLLDPITQRLLETAGLRPGSRVLDLGSGSGNVSMLAAQLVGPEGSVVGVDRNAIAASRSQKYFSAMGIDNVEFRAADVQTLDGVEDGFDAVVGRLVYMYLEDPTEALRRAATRVRPGGLICLQEPDMSYWWSAPETPLWRQIYDWFQETMRRAKIEPRMGHALFSTFTGAGLPNPEMNLESRVWGGEQMPTYGWADVVIGALPLMEKLGVVTAAEVDPDTLGDRLHAELVEADGVMITGPLVGAWAERPTEMPPETAVRASNASTSVSPR